MKYIKDRKEIIILFIVIIMAFFLIFYLYSLPYDALLYGYLLISICFICILSIDHYHYNKKLKQIEYLKREGLTNKIIVSDKYISNPEILKNIDKLVDINKYNRILRIAKDFVARRWYMNAKRYNFPIDKCDFYGVVDNRNISKNDWYKSEVGINQVMKEFINIGELTINNELSIK